METFAGIGAQHKAITNIKGQTHNKFKVTKTAEWDARAVIAYSLIHHKYDVENVLKKNKLETEEKINKWLLDRTFSLNSKTPGHVIRKPLNFKKRLAAASITNRNNPDITKVKGSDIRDVDLLTYSFPCQGLSVANMGRAKGIKRDADSTSNLIWQIGGILQEAKDNDQQLPKYLLMENVRDLLNKKHLEDYEEWKNLLKDSLGYDTFTFQLRADNFGMVQTRKRVFGISILNPNKEWTQEMIQEMLDGQKYVLNKEESVKEIKKILNFNLNNKTLIEEYKHAVPNNTKSRVKMAKENKDLTKKGMTRINTLTTKQDRHPNVGMIPYKNNFEGKLDYRFITPREAYQIMGFDSKDFDKVRDEWLVNKTLTKESLYRQAGNSIAVKVLEAVFKVIDQIEKREND
ncbi:DNA (cytosine-5-)-methyltransferase [Mycoplasma marinum]|uniref:DNA (cytosine-5-)-methyltransferase n=1 Tax=Mycoplasma marinum TaxID=1937190 RepID=A0A4R0XSN2_9MOLU|nr:DNA (cytosine-5-)-methyltransferase [Mycoplasma marinum]TCG10609.1 CpG DNA methylase [Mycoplasma marinum]